jgi:hypothetical protein
MFNIGKINSFGDTISRRDVLANSVFFMDLTTFIFLCIILWLDIPQGTYLKRMRKEGKGDDEEGRNPNLYFYISFCGQRLRSGP